MFKRLLIGLALLPALANADPAFDNAVRQHAQGSAREFMSKLVDQRSKGYSWKMILNTQVPGMLEDGCGYRERVGLPDRSFKEMKQQVVPVVGSQLVERYESLLSKPSARLGLVTVKSAQDNSGDYAVVVLKTLSSSKSDPYFSLIYQLNDNGRMSLCDISKTDDMTGGLLEEIGSKLNL
ncbi:hypothetical protein [Pseudomonas sp. CFBP 13719]|uniref:hypothetical protein n=1 Tax=Pseudomonas sp. CFBP 13719 TaxID=2775303 RepID=UPI001785B0B0|nr:hypothetical protein [Pseudomonas sp. CFBP 13719]MBD8681969.1 hypothetical protein [Pseudomonas sp. CFBP 13719]